MAADIEAARQAAKEQDEAATEAARDDIQGRLGEVVDKANAEGEEHAGQLRSVETDASERAEAVIGRLDGYREQAALTFRLLWESCGGRSGRGSRSGRASLTE